MSFAPLTTALTAPTEPDEVRAEGSALAERDLAAERERVERHLRILAELAEIGMRLARAAAENVNSAEPVSGDQGLVFSRIARAVRQTVALEARIAEDWRALVERNLAGQKAALAEATARAAKAEQSRKARHRAKVDRVLEQVIEAEDSDDFDFESEAQERLDDLDDAADFADQPIGAIIAQICRDLGIRPDWSRWEDKYWAVEEARTQAPGSPYATQRAAQAAEQLPPAGPHPSWRWFLEPANRDDDDGDPSPRDFHTPRPATGAGPP